MDVSPGVGGIVLRASITMEKAVASLKLKTTKGNRDAHDWCVRSLTLLDLLSIIEPTVKQEKKLSTERDPLLFQLSTASAAIENILTALARAEILRVEDSTAINGGSQKSRQHEVTKTTLDNKQESASLKTGLSTSFKDIVGNFDAKQALYENVVLPLTICDATKVNIFSGIRAGSGNVMLHGPAGTGKTIMCQAAAFEAKATLIIVRPSDVLSKYHGESERYLRGVFERARAVPRAVIFFDEFDSIAATRGGLEDGMSSRRLLSELLLQLTEQKQIQAQESRALVLKLSKATNSSINNYDQKSKRKSYTDLLGEVRKKRSPMVVSATHNTESRDRYSMIESRANICIDIDAEGGQGSRDILMSASEACSQGKGEGEDEEYSGDGGGSGLVVIAATNRLEDIDPAVVRRFESRVYVGVPDHDTRVSMLISFLRSIETRLTEEDLHSISDSTAGWSGSEIETLCREAAMAPVRAVWGYSYSSFCPDQHTDSAQLEEERTDKQASKGYNFYSPSSAISDDSEGFSSPIRPVELNDFLVGIDTMMKRGNDAIVS